MKNRLISVLVLIAIVFAVAGCTGNDATDPYAGFSHGSQAKAYKVGIVLSYPGKGDQGINDATIAGAKMAETQLGIEYKILNIRDLVDDQESLKYFAENNFDLIIAAGPNLAKPLNDVAPQYKDRKFAIVDTYVDQPNVTSIMFNEEDGGFLAGMAAGSLTKTNLVGFIGGAQVEEEERMYQNGYLKGLQFVNTTANKSLKSYVSYAGVFEKDLFKPEKGLALANSQYGNGADIIFQVAGQTGNGVYNAAVQMRKFVIGNNLKQSAQAQYNSYGTVVKKVDYAVFNVIKAAYQNKLLPGVLVNGIRNGAVDFIPGTIVPPEVVNKIKNAKVNLAKGLIDLTRIKLPDEIQLKVPTPPQQPTGQGAGGTSLSQGQQGHTGRQNGSGTKHSNQSNNGTSQKGSSDTNSATPGQGGSTGTNTNTSNGSGGNPGANTGNSGTSTGNNTGTNPPPVSIEPVQGSGQ